MSTKSHFIYEAGLIEGFEETSEPRTTFGKLRGFNAYLYIDPSIIKSFEIEYDFIKIETKNTDILPKRFKVFGANVISAGFDGESYYIALEGGYDQTRRIIKGEYTTY